MDAGKDDCAKSWSHSKMTTFKIEHIWKIDQFVDKTVQMNRPLKSGIFSQAGHDLKFSLELTPASRELQQSSKYVELRLRCVQGFSLNGQVSVAFDLALIRTDKSEYIEEDLTMVFTNATGVGVANGNARFVHLDYVLDEMNKFLHDEHQLVVRCRAIVSYNRVTLSSLHPPETDIDPRFVSQLSAMLNEGTFSDFTLICDSVEIPVHKAILSARSAVFKAMFAHKDNKEVQEGKLEVFWASPPTLKAFLQFIYTGVSPESGQLTMEMFQLANFYHVNQLIRWCELKLSDEITVDNVISVFHEAFLHDAAKLKASCLAVICANYARVKRTAEWTKLASENALAMAEILDYVMSNADNDCFVETKKKRF